LVIKYCEVELILGQQNRAPERQKQKRRQSELVTINTELRPFSGFAFLISIQASEMTIHGAFTHGAVLLGLLT